MLKDACDCDVDEEEDVGESNAEPYRIGRRLLMGSGGPTISAPGRAVNRDERRDAELVDCEAEEEEDEAKVR